MAEVRGVKPPNNQSGIEGVHFVRVPALVVALLRKCHDRGHGRL
jgi:hypothetical protein